MRPGNLVSVAGLTLGALLVTAGCGDSSDPDSATDQDTPATASADPASPRPATSIAPLPPGSETPPPVLPLPAAVTGAPLPGTTSGPAGPGQATSAPGEIALPTLGAYPYALTGTSTLGNPPKTMRLDVSATATTPVAQLWSLDARRGDGGGLVEDLTLTQQDGGVYLSGYRLEASTGIAEVVLDFAAATPVLFTPDGGAVGHTWNFDLKSTNGCAAAHGEGVVIAPGTAAAPRHFKLSIALKSIGPPTCVALAGKRVMDFFHPVEELLPSRLDAVLDGRLAGVPVESNTQATAQPAAPKPLARRDDPA